MNNEPKKILVIFNHSVLSPDQIKFLNNSGILNIEYMPDILSCKWADIDPCIEKLDLSDFKRYLISNTRENDLVLIQGDFGATFELADFCLQIGRIPIYSTTKRIVTETKNDDGTVEKSSIFKFIRFRKYSRSSFTN